MKLMEVNKHMARIAGVDLPREKRVEIGLTYIYGIGRTSSNRILAEAKVDLPTFLHFSQISSIASINSTQV